MARLELEVSADLIRDLRRMAQLHYGDGGEAALGRVVEAAIEIRLLWANFVEKDGNQVEEAVSTWEFPGETGIESLPEEITDWMFKRGEQK